GIGAIAQIIKDRWCRIGSGVRTKEQNVHRGLAFAFGGHTCLGASRFFRAGIVDRLEIAEHGKGSPDDDTGNENKHQKDAQSPEQYFFLRLRLALGACWFQKILSHIRYYITLLIT